MQGFRRRACQPSLRVRLWAGALLLTTLALGGAAFAVLGLTLVEGRAREALAAQSRLEGWTTLSTRINEWLLTRMMLPAEPKPATAPIEEAIARLNELTRLDVESAPSPEEASQRALAARHIAQARSFFNQLTATQFGTRAGEAGLRFHLTHAPSVMSARVEHETRRREEALHQMEALRTPLRLGMLAVALASLTVLWVFWRGTIQPLLAGLRVAGLPSGQAPKSHDELGLMFARSRQISARIARRRAALERDLARLETLVADRTAALSQANNRLAEIDASRRRFFADVSHELRTPLTVILGEAELGALSPDPMVQRSFATIQARAQRLFRRIEDLLRIARSESGQLELVQEPIALAELIETARQDVSQLLERAGITTRIEVPSALILATDPEWMRQVFVGLFENALKFAGPQSAITVTAGVEGAMARVDFSDDGKGPQPPLDTPLFQRHARGMQSKVSGFGIGLALAHWVVTTSGGELSREPATQGFHLVLRLPLWEESTSWDIS